VADDQLAALTAASVSIWLLDDLSRGRLVGGDPRRLIDDTHVVGVTTSPTLLAAALAHRGVHTPQIRELPRRGATLEEAVRTLMVVDVQAACELFRGVREASDGVDGRVSLEANSDLVGNCEATVVSLM
jgi:transaldolase